MNSQHVRLIQVTFRAWAVAAAVCAAIAATACSPSPGRFELQLTWGGARNANGTECDAVR